MESVNESDLNFLLLSEINPELTRFTYNKYGTTLIDWRKKGALVELNKAVLLDKFGLIWSMPYEGYLVPCVSSRESYLDWVYTLMSCSTIAAHSNYESENWKICNIGIDVGIGCSAIYPLIGNKKYDTCFICTDINSSSITNSEELIKRNNLEDKISIFLNFNSNSVFRELDAKIRESIVKLSNISDKGQKCIAAFSMCNPPYFAGTKLNNKDKFCSYNVEEVQCEGGEFEFIKTKIEDSALLHDSVLWFTSLVGIKENFKLIKDMLYSKQSKGEITEVIENEIKNGNQTRWFVGWSYFKINIDLAQYRDYKNKTNQHNQLSKGQKMLSKKRTHK